MTTPNLPPRFLPEEPLPPYSFVPGKVPHPVSDPAGHLYGKPPERPAPIDPENWRESRAYLRGLDLFNHGFFWEAHEVWEGLWHAAGRKGVTADFLKGLIKLAAAGVKFREGRPDGVRSHLARAGELFRRVSQVQNGAVDRLLGLSLHDLIQWTAETETASANFDLILLPLR